MHSSFSPSFFCVILSRKTIYFLFFLVFSGAGRVFPSCCFVVFFWLSPFFFSAPRVGRVLHSPVASLRPIGEGDA
jgi:hypothetical protein